MSNRRVDLTRLQEMVRLHRTGEKPRRIARLLAMSPNSERFYRRLLDDAGLLQGDAASIPSAADMRSAIQERAPAVIPPQQISTVVAWSDQVRALMAKGMGPRAIHAQLSSADERFAGSYPAIKRLCRRLRAESAPAPTSKSDVAPAASEAPRTGRIFATEVA